MCYSLIRKFLFCLKPEISHDVTLKLLNVLNSLGFLRGKKIPQQTIELLGLQFPNRIGLAAGLDKNGDYIDALSQLGFGFIEVGTITKKPQAGNPKPRLFRLAKENAIINRMGFNNKGVDYLVKNLQKIKYRGILGINIGKNKETSLENAPEEYAYLFRAVAPFASYVTINISSPNTENLRSLQHGELLQKLLSAVKKEQLQFHQAEKKYIPLVVKIAPDLTDDELASIAKIILHEGMDAVIATNTTISRQGVEDSQYAKEAGGLSGLPLRNKSTEIVRKLSALIIENKIPIIGCGGIFSHEDVQEKLTAGASLVQIYTGLIYQGPWKIFI